MIVELRILPGSLISRIQPIEHRELLKIIDPNVGTPEEMKQIIELINKVTIPAYNNNGVNDLEQKLDNIKVIPLEEGITIISGQMQEIGVVHQYLGTCPVNLSQKGV